ncbi:MAG: gephyrin-like molybdotransferase Glp [Aliishimia sp.]
MISVAQAQALCIDMVTLVGTEPVPLSDAAGRVLLGPIKALRDQPPFAASAMDGYALKAAEVERDALFKVIGESAAGHRFEGHVGAGQAVRIFTGAPLPEGADFVLIQEDATRSGDLITVSTDKITKNNIRPKGTDFTIGDALSAPRRLSPGDTALIAAMNQPNVQVARKPRVALLSTGDELVMPGGTPGPDQIIASNVFGLAAMLRATGAEPRIFPIAEDTDKALDTVFAQADEWQADFVVTIGGASVGDHDLVAPAMDRFGVSRAFHKIAMRPGKPLMAGTKDSTAWIGLPGNPVSAMVCGHLFLLPMVRRAMGLKDVLPERHTARLNAALTPNGPREHYMRAHVSGGVIDVFERQDSSLLTVLAQANALAIRPIADTAREKNDILEFIFL